MKSKKLLVVGASLTLLCALALVFYTNNQQDSTNFEKAYYYLKAKGYDVVSSFYSPRTIIMTKENMLDSHIYEIWAVQKVDAKKYLDKKIEFHKFEVKNHPLEKRHAKIAAMVMVCENKVIGGYCFSDVRNVRGGDFYSIDGKTVEEFTGLKYYEWQEQWKEKFE